MKRCTTSPAMTRFSSGSVTGVPSRCMARPLRSSPFSTDAVRLSISSGRPVSNSAVNSVSSKST